MRRHAVIVAAGHVSAVNSHIQVMIVDDHDVVRRGLSLFLSGFEDLLLVGEAANGADAIRLCRVSCFLMWC